MVNNPLPSSLHNELCCKNKFFKKSNWLHSGHVRQWAYIYTPADFVATLLSNIHIWKYDMLESSLESSTSQACHVTWISQLWTLVLRLVALLTSAAPKLESMEPVLIMCNIRNGRGFFFFNLRTSGSTVKASHCKLSTIWTKLEIRCSHPLPPRITLNNVLKCFAIFIQTSFNFTITQS